MKNWIKLFRTARYDKITHRVQDYSYKCKKNAKKNNHNLIQNLLIKLNLFLLAGIFLGQKIKKKYYEEEIVIYNFINS